MFSGSGLPDCKTNTDPLPFASLPLYAGKVRLKRFLSGKPLTDMLQPPRGEFFSIWKYWAAYGSTHYCYGLNATKQYRAPLP